MAKKETVTKEEMDELSQALETGKDEAESKPGSTRNYDFAHPDKLSRPNVRALQLVFSALERSWSARLSEVFKNEITVSVGSMEQSTLGAYMESFPAEFIVVTIGTKSLYGDMYLDMPGMLGLSIVNRLTGGTGKISGKPRKLTAIELSIIKRVVGRLCGDFANAWTPVAKMQLKPGDVLYQSVEDMELDLQELVMIANTTWTINGEEHPISIAVPVNALEPILEDLDPQRWRRSTGPTQSDADLMATVLEPVCVELSAELGHASISMEDLMGMGVGDVIRLDRTVNDLLDVSVGGHVKLTGRPGLVGKNISLQIKGRVAESVEPAIVRPSAETE